MKEVGEGVPRELPLYGSGTVVEAGPNDFVNKDSGYQARLSERFERQRGLIKSEFQPDEQALVDVTATIEALYPEHADEADKLLTGEMGRVYSNGKKVSICRKPEEVFASVYKKIKRINLHLASQNGFE
jgi:hypothetical protein